MGRQQQAVKRTSPVFPFRCSEALGDLVIVILWKLSSISRGWGRKGQVVVAGIQEVPSLGIRDPGETFRSGEFANRRP